MIRLGILGSRAVYADDRIWTHPGIGRLVDALARKFHTVNVALSASLTKHPLFDHAMAIERSQYLPLPPLPSLVRGFYKVRSSRRVIRELERRSDVLLVQLPFEAPAALMGPRTPRVYHVCADLRQMASQSSRYRGATRIAAMLVADGIDRFYRRLILRDDARVITNGAALFAHYGASRGCHTVSSCIWESEVQSVRRQRPLDAPFRVLFVGYLRAEKGIDTLLAAFEELLTHVPNAELEIVGPREAAQQGVSDVILKAVKSLSARATVRFLGPKGYGPELFECFAEADVLAVPSRSEGTPRVLLDARAFGCPVVGSAVGGIPTSITDGVDGLIVPPNDPHALAQALIRIAREPELRETLVSEGLCRVRASTLEAFADTITDEVMTLWNSRPRTGSRAAQHA